MPTFLSERPSWVGWQNLDKSWEEKQRSEPVFSQDAWLSLFSQALKGEGAYGDQHIGGQGSV